MKTTSKDKQTTSHSMRFTALRFLCLLPLLGAITAQASTVGWYRMEGTVGEEILTVNNSEGTAPNLTAGTRKATYGSNVPGSQIYDPINDMSYANTSSIQYTGNSSTAYIEASDANSAPFEVADFTIEMFIKVDSTEGGTVDSFINHIGSGFDGWLLRISPESGSGGSQIGGIVDNNNISDPINPAVIDDGIWHHVAMAVKTSDDGNNFARLYFDSNLMFEKIGGSVDSYTPEVNGPFQIFTSDFAGFTDEYRFSDSVLAPEDFLVAIPEPGTLTLLGIGMIAIVLGARCRSKR